MQRELRVLPTKLDKEVTPISYSVHTKLDPIITKLQEDPYFWARKAKQEGKKVIAVTPMFFPEELVHASGAVPVVLQQSWESISLGWGELPTTYCAITRSNVDISSKGKLDKLFDGLVLSDICTSMRFTGQLLQRRLSGLPTVHIQWVIEESDRAVPVIAKQLKKCVAQIAEITGVMPSDQDVQRSVALYNRNRALLRRAYRLGMEKRLMTVRHLTYLTQSSMVMPKEDSCALLEGIIRDLEAAAAPPPSKEHTISIYLTGSLCHIPKMDVLAVIDALGGDIVGDDVYGGRRYFEVDAPEHPSLDDWARHHVALAFPAPTRIYPSRDWSSWVVDRAKSSGAKGVVIILMKYCEPLCWSIPRLDSRLESAGIGSTLLELDHEELSLQRVHTQLQAFMEQIRGVTRL